MIGASDNGGIRSATPRGLKIAISMIWYSGAVLSRSVLRLARRAPSTRFVVLYYHGVPDEARARFARQLDALSRSATVVHAGHIGPLPSASPCVAITFDDALQSVRVNAVPELLRQGFPATIFVPLHDIGRTPSWESEDGVIDDLVMTREELQSLPDLIDLGSHSVTHPHLTCLDREGLHDEVTASRTQLAALTRSPVLLFAFPYGDHDARVVATCRRAGYERVFGINPSLADPAGGDFVRGRVAVDPTDGALVFHLKARGAYGWMVYASAAKRSLLRWGQIS